jgi:hypothetical protein
MSAKTRLLCAVAALAAVTGTGFGLGWMLAGNPRLGTAGTAAPPAPAIGPVAVTLGTARPSVDTVGGARAPVAATRPQFTDVAAQFGVHFTYFRGETGDFWLPETMGGGAAWLDYDGDGWLDLYFVQGCQLPEDRSGDHVNVLYRNTGHGSWQEVPRWAASSDAGYGMGVAVGDVDNDGFDDVYVTNYGPDAFYHNHGDGTFSEATQASGLGCPLWGTSAAFGDLKRNGTLDLFVCNYVHVDPAIQCRDPGTNKRKYCGPDYYRGQPDALYDNTGDGRFTEVSQPAGVSREDGKGLGVVIADLLDSDGWPEIFVANDLVANFLFRNLGGRTNAAAPDDRADAPSAAADALRFEEVGVAVGAAFNDEGIREANMGIACADYDENGQLDLYVTHYFMEHDTLWQNVGPAGFRDVTKPAGLGLPTLAQLSWGTNFIDYDNDGWLDLFVTSGHINDYGESTVPYAMRPQLFYNAAGREQPVRFHEVSGQAGRYFAERYVGRGSAAADYDRDGRMDLVVTHHHRPAAVLHNESEPVGHALGLRLVGTRSNRTAFGARVLVTLDDPAGTQRRLMREIVGGGSYLCADARELLVGTGTADRADAVEVHWPSGAVHRYAGLTCGGYWIIREGELQPRFTSFEP